MPERKLYVGNLDLRVTEDMLYHIFSNVGQVLSVKIVDQPRARASKHHTHNYGFVEFSNEEEAQMGLTMSGQRIYDSVIRVNWACHSNNVSKLELDTHYHVFVGDLSPDITEDTLTKMFSIYPSLSEARVMWDAFSGKSRGFGFVAFSQREDAELAIQQQNGKLLGNRAIRCNWAAQKSTFDSNSNPDYGYNSPYPYASNYFKPYTPNRTVYVGNLAPAVTVDQLLEYFLKFGSILEIKSQVEKGYAFVKFQTSEAAEAAIANVNGAEFKGRTIKCSWGKERVPSDQPIQFPIPVPYSVEFGQYQIAPVPFPYFVPPFSMMKDYMSNHQSIPSPRAEDNPT